MDQLSTKLDDTSIERLDIFARRLMEWNRIHNLTGSKTYEEIHLQIMDSIWPLTFLPPFESLLDIGTGAGFPGMVLAVVLPDTECTLCEPIKKRASFLRFICLELNLENVNVEARRIEELDPRPYNMITSRAVAETKTLIEWCRPFVDKNTQILFYKGEKVQSEIEGMQRCKIEIIAHGKRNYLWIKEASEC